MTEGNEIEDKFFAKAYNFVSFRPRSTWEITQLLKRRKAPENVVPKVLKRLARLDQVDDLKFAVWWIEQRLRFRPKGRRLLELELRGKGIDKNIILQALTTLPPPEEEADQARKILDKKLKTLVGLDPQKRRQRALGFLLRRGYSADLAYRLVDEEAQSE